MIAAELKAILGASSGDVLDVETDGRREEAIRKFLSDEENQRVRFMAL